MPQIYILGVGHNTPVTIELAEACGYTVAGLYHYDNSRTGETDHDYPIIGSFDDLYKQDLTGKNFALSMGNNTTRRQVFEQLKRHNANLPVLVHPSAVVSKFATLDEGVQICVGSIVMADVKIGQNTIISENATIIHSSEIGSHSFVAPNACVGAYTIMEENVFIGLNATIISGKVPTIGTNAIIGAGSVVTKSVEDNAVVCGNPAKIVRMPVGGG